MDSDVCPNCGSTEQQTRYNKWHVKEIYCVECFTCLNQEQVRERTRLAEMASKEGKLNEFYLGTYEPSTKE